EDIAAALRAEQAVMDQAVRVIVQEGAVNARAGQLVELVRARETDASRVTAEPVNAVGGRAGLPLDVVVVELDVEVAVAAVVALDEDHLEKVCLIVFGPIVIDVVPGGSEGEMAVELAGPVIDDVLRQADVLSVGRERRIGLLRI